MNENELNAVIEETLSRAGKTFTNVGTLPAILSEADQRLSERLHRVVDREGPDMKFGEAQALLFRKQIRLVQDYTNKRLMGLTHEQAKNAIRSSATNALNLATLLERRFTGVAQPLPLLPQSYMDHVVRGTGSSLLRQHQSSVDRYGSAMIGDFERQLRVGLLTGMSNSEIISRLVETGQFGGVNAARLHAATPSHFPPPTSYTKRRYWAERIVRTEVAYAYNAGALSGLHEMRQSMPDMGKKILAHFDQRTAQDSIAVHGQVRKLEEYFMDGAGRQYLHPPARPNDRETIIPWRLGWKELPATKPEDAQNAAPKQPGATAPKGPEASPNTLLGDIMAANERVRARRDPAAASAEREAAERAAATARATREAAARVALAQRQAEDEARRRREALERAEQAEARRRQQAEAAAERQRRAEQRDQARREREQRAAAALAAKEAKAKAAIKPKPTKETKADPPGFISREAGLDAYGARNNPYGLKMADLAKVFGTKGVPSPEWWAQTFRPPKGYVIADSGLEWGESMARWRAVIRDAKGDRVGEIERTFSREAGKLKVKHDLLRLIAPEKHESVGGSILARSNKVYDQLGVKTVKLSTAWDGKVVWAHMGFDWENDYERQRMNSSFANYLADHTRLTAEQVRTIVKTLKTPRDILNVEINPPAEKPERKNKGEIRSWELGRKFLANTGGWYGKLERDDNDEGYKIYKTKLAAAEKRLREKGTWGDDD